MLLWRLWLSNLRLALVLPCSWILLRPYGSRAAPLRRNSEVGRSAILQAEAVLAAALRDLDSARASIVDYTAAVAIARRHLGLGGFGDDQDA